MLLSVACLVVALTQTSVAAEWIGAGGLVMQQQQCSKHGRRHKEPPSLVGYSGGLRILRICLEIPKRIPEGKAVHCDCMLSVL